MNRAVSFALNIIERPAYLHFDETGSALATIHRHLVGVSRDLQRRVKGIFAPFLVQTLVRFSTAPWRLA